MKMKNLITTALALTALFMLGACTSDDSVSQSVDGTTSQDPLPIGFDTYLGRAASTRASVYTADNLGVDGIGIYAMYSKDVMYSPTESSLFVYVPDYRYRMDFPTTKNFTPNFMDNIKLYYDNTLKVWTYKPVRYWPMYYNEFITFFAYGPYETPAPTLYTKTETTTGEGDAAVTTATFTEGGDQPIYKKYVVDKDPKNHKDIVWNYNQTWNMQLYVKFFLDDGTYQTSENYYWSGSNLMTDLWQPTDKETYPGSPYGRGYYAVKFKMGHATSRIAYSITSPALLNADNFKDGETNSNTQIKINKLMFLGDAKSATSDNPKGAFYGSGYLNIASDSHVNLNSSGTETRGTAQWEGIDAENKVAFTFTDFYAGTYDNTRKPNIWEPDASKTTNNIISSTKGEDGKITVNSIGNASDGYLFVIPQDLSLKDDDIYPIFFGRQTFEDRPLYCYIDYTVQYKDITTGEVKDGVTYRSYGMVSQNFEAGKAYVIHIQIGNPDGGSTSPIETQLNSIHFTVDIDSWPDEQEVSSDAGIDWNTGFTTGTL